MEETNKSLTLKEILIYTSLFLFSIAMIGFLWWLIRNAKDPSPEEECRTMILGPMPNPQGIHRHPRRVFELGCDTMQEFKKIREEIKMDALKKRGVLFTASPSTP